jgi:hypothetical protein
MNGCFSEAEWTRRRFGQAVSAGVLGCGLPEFFEQEAAAGEASVVARAKQVLVVYEEGGISQMDSWDPKPAAPVDHRSPFAPIPTSVPGVHFSSLMPMIAQQAHRLAVVRSMTTADSPSHPNGCKEFFKGYRFNAPLEFPDIGSVVTHLLGTDCPQLPGYVFCPGVNMPNAVTSTGFLPAARAPWKLGTKGLGENVADPEWKVAALTPQSGLSHSRMGNRQRLLDDLDRQNSLAIEHAKPLQQYYANAFDLLTSPQVQSAFDLSSETDRMRDRYGRDHRGCCYLLGRKLIEAGVRFVSVTIVQPPDLVGRPNYGQPNGVFLNWDHHEGIYNNGPCGGPQGMRNQERYGLPHPVMMPSLDRSFSALLEDLDQRGLLDETLVCFVTEMGRTPRMNQWAGRDHWGRAMSIAFAGAGVPGGTVVGATDLEGGDVIDRRYTPADYAETIYHKLGIDTAARLQKADGRPIDFSDGGKPIVELV